MTNDEAEAMLRALSEHYRQPVMPVSRYCAAFETWFRQVHQNPRSLRWAEHVPHILLGIRKSNLLARLIYGGEKLREVPCPAHKGHWIGCFPVSCGHGCGHVGWLPEAHAFEPVTLEAWGEHPQRTVCQRCGGLESAEVHGLTADDRAARRQRMASYRQCRWCQRDGSASDAACPGCGQPHLKEQP